MGVIKDIVLNVTVVSKRNPQRKGKDFFKKTWRRDPGIYNEPK